MDSSVTHINDYLADGLINDLRQSIYHGGDSLDSIPDLLVTIIGKDIWRERVIQATGEVVRFGRFEKFVNTPPLEGLDTEIRTLKNLCRDDKTALDAIDTAMVEERGAPEENQNASKTNDNNVNNCFPRTSPVGNSNTYALRKLRKDRRDLHEQVLAGKLSPNGAMVEAGFRDKTVTVPVDYAKAARTLRKHFDLDKLISALRGEE